MSNEGVNGQLSPQWDIRSMIGGRTLADMTGGEFDCHRADDVLGSRPSGVEGGDYPARLAGYVDQIAEVANV